ncbi:PKD domain-containing protein [Chitinophaga sancti]|uniref:PKD domain-containing protein n=1 Tax=Chitinophaga sancti TaxID=1004 RepID=UPI003F7A8A44
MRRLLLLFVLHCIGTHLSAQSLTARYSVDSAVVCAGQQTIHFTDQSTGNITSWNWDFGDGTTSTLQSPSHAYVSHGRYLVTLVVKDADGNVDTARVSDKQDTIYVLSDLQVPRYYLLNQDEVSVTLKDTGFGSRFSEFPQIYEWSTGETTPSINVSTEGLYWVSWKQCGFTHRDTIRVARLNAPLSISRADSGYYGNIDLDRFEQHWKYNFPFPYGTYTNSVIKVDNDFSSPYSPYESMLISYQSGKKELAASISVTLAPGVVCHTNTVSEVRVPPRVPYLVHNSWNGRDTTFRSGDTLFLHDVNVGASYRWHGLSGYSEGATLKIFEAGYYSIMIYKDGDTAFESIHVNEQSKLATSFKWSRSDCDSSAISFKESFANVADGDAVIAVNYDFGDKVIDSVSSPDNFYYRFSQGIAHVVLSIKTKNGDTASYAQDIYIPHVAAWSASVKDDTIPCTGTVRLTASTTGHAKYYLWTTGDSTQSIIVNKTGVYNCTIQDSCSVNRDFVSFYARVSPKIEFGVSLKRWSDHDTLVATNSLFLDEIYTWYKDGVKLPDTVQQIETSGSGIYTVEFTHRDGCSYSASYNYENYKQPAAVLTSTRDFCDTSQFFLLGKVENLPAGDSIISKIYDYKNADTSTSEWLFRKYPPGIYYPTFTAVTASGHTYTTSVKLVVAEYHRPTVSIALRTGAVKDTIVVTPNDHDKSIFTLTWDRLVGNEDPVRLPDTGWSIIPTVPGTYVAIAHYSTYDCRDYESIDYAGKVITDTSKLRVHTTFSASSCDSSVWMVQGIVDEIVGSDAVKTVLYDYGDGSSSTEAKAHTYATPGSYNVSFSVVTIEGRTASNTTQLIVPAFTPVSVSLSVHKGTQDTIFAHAGYHDQSSFTYKWSKEGISLDDTNWFIFPSASGTYKVVVATAQGCTAENTIQYTPAPAAAEVKAPVANADMLDLSANFRNVTFNADNEFTIQLQVKDPNGRTIYATEVLNLGTIKGTDPTNLSVSIPDSLACASNYTVRVISSSPADTTLWSSAFSITNQPSQPVIKQVGDSLFTSSIYDLQWYKDDVAMSGATSAAIRARANGAYKVAALNGEGCSSISDARAVVITAISSVILGGNTVSAYPNPSEGPVYLKFGYPLTEKVSVKVYNLNGAAVYATTTVQQQTLLNLSGLPKGFYTVEVSVKDSRKVMNIILQ